MGRPFLSHHKAEKLLKKMSEKKDQDSHHSSDPIHNVKSELRAWAKKRREDLGKEQRELISGRICQNILESVTFPLTPAPAVVSGYWPMDYEIDIVPLLRELYHQGHPLCLPVVKGKNLPLSFRSWSPGDPLVSAGFGVQIPKEDAAELFPKILITPLLSFDREGNRLGYGGGFYDRTLEFLRSHGEVYAVGVAYSALEVNHVPVKGMDQPIDAIATEKEFIRFS